MATAFEALLAILLVSGLFPFFVWHAALLIFCTFEAITAFETIRGSTSCGCFGAVQIKPIYTMTFDLAATCLLLVTGTPARFSPPNRLLSFWRIAMSATLAICWLIGVGEAVQTRPPVMQASVQDFGKPGTLVVLEPEKLAGQRFSLSEHINNGSTLALGRWTVLLVHHDCDHCAAAVRRYLSASQITGVDWKLAVVEVPPFGDAEHPPPWQLPASVFSGRLDETRDWFATTPVMLLVNNGDVVFGKESDAAEMPDPRLSMQAGAPAP